MPANVDKCLKCEARMEEGFVALLTYEGRYIGTWIEGSPTRSAWTGLQIKGRRQLPTKTMRCTRCGFLETYAR